MIDIDPSRVLFERTTERLAGYLALPGLDAQASWQSAGRIVAARLVLALARERLIDAELRGDALVVAGGPALPLRRVRALELHTPELLEPRAPLLEQPTLAWEQLAARIALPEGARERIAIELADGVPRLALALWVAAMQRRFPGLVMRRHPAPQDGEDLVTVGHPWHPMAKTRLGLGWAENLRHAPELFGIAPISAIDLPRADTQVHGDATGLLAPWLGTPDRDHVRIPVHRAQLRRLPRLLPAELLARARVVARPDVRGRSLLSLRTAALPGGALHVKLALDVHTTSARRVVSPMSVANGPQLSQLIGRVAVADPLTSRGLTLQADLGTIGVHPDVAGASAGQLAAIVRDGSVIAGETLVCAAIGELDEAGSPVAYRILAGYDGDGPTKARAMWHDYLAMLVPPALRLWTAHGIALELHLQNTLVRIEMGRPVGFVVRDLGGIRVHRPRVRRAGHTLELAPASFIVTDDEHTGAAKLTHALIHAHLAAVIGVLLDYGLPEPEAWAMVHARMAACLDAWSREPALQDACAFDRAYLFAPNIRAKALLRMRIDDRSSDYSFVELANPIAAHGAGAPGSDKQ